MIPELGTFSLILALCLALLVSSLPLWGSYRNNATLMSLAAPLTVGLFTFVAIAFALLIICLVQDDFSVRYVAGHSNFFDPLTREC